MELYIGHLTSNDTISDLRRFFKGYGKKARFRIVKLLRAEGPLYFGLVEMDSERLARKALKKLHTCKLNGHRVCVREYEYRAGSNERRALNWRNITWQNTERRISERREKSRLEPEDEPEYSGYDNMVIKRL
ncbi:MAG: RNA-binding protein [Granulosicoccaceae bacterium]|jgi:RNA recognition motif-containing protein